jgi:hypothetical protein
VVKKLDCESKETQTNQVRSKLNEILKVYQENMFPEKYRDNRKIGPFKYRFRLSIFQINYSIDDIDYRKALKSLVNRAPETLRVAFLKMAAELAGLLHHDKRPFDKELSEMRYAGVRVETARPMLELIRERYIHRASHTAKLL